MYAIYIRTHPGHAWRYHRQTQFVEVALLDRAVNENFNTETLIVPVVAKTLPKFLDSYQTQSDFKSIQKFVR